MTDHKEQTKDMALDASSTSDVKAFMAKARHLASNLTEDSAKGRIIFALDATLSRQPTWDMACNLQAEMFEVVQTIGGLEVQLNYYRGFRECRASKWVDDAATLAAFMGGIQCQGGRTQLAKVLTNARKEQKRKKVDALVFIGDAMEENLDSLCERAGELGLLGVPVFIFQEGYDAVCERAFRELARLSKGAYVRFDDKSSDELAALLRAVAIYATGGMAALADKNDHLLLPQMKG